MRRVSPGIRRTDDRCGDVEAGGVCAAARSARDPARSIDPAPVVALGAGLLAALVAAREAGNWGIFLQFLYHVPYGADDPLYGKDIGFYLFSLPAYIAIKNWMLLAIVVSALFAGAIYWARGDIEYDVHRRSMSPTAIAHGSALAGLLFAVKAWSYGLDRYLLLYGDNGVVVGASYTDIHVRLPVLWLMVGLSVTAAFTAGPTCGAHLPASCRSGVLLFGDGSVVLSERRPCAVPALLRQADRVAAGEALHRAQHRTHPAGLQSRPDRGQAVCRRTGLTSKTLEANQATIDNIRLWDWLPLIGYLRAAAGDPHLLQVP